MSLGIPMRVPSGFSQPGYHSTSLDALTDTTGLRRSKKSFLFIDW
jgi:hypothetical protein